jgi:hypothetical protein
MARKVYIHRYIELREAGYDHPGACDRLKVKDKYTRRDLGKRYAAYLEPKPAAETWGAPPTEAELACRAQERADVAAFGDYRRANGPIMSLAEWKAAGKPELRPEPRTATIISEKGKDTQTDLQTRLGQIQPKKAENGQNDPSQPYDSKDQEKQPPAIPTEPNPQTQPTPPSQPSDPDRGITGDPYGADNYRDHFERIADLQYFPADQIRGTWTESTGFVSQAQREAWIRSLAAKPEEAGPDDY